MFPALMETSFSKARLHCHLPALRHASMAITLAWGRWWEPDGAGSGKRHGGYGKIGKAVGHWRILSERWKGVMLAAIWIALWAYCSARARNTQDHLLYTSLQKLTQHYKTPFPPKWSKMTKQSKTFWLIPMTTYDNASGCTPSPVHSSHDPLFFSWSDSMLAWSNGQRPAWR